MIRRINSWLNINFIFGLSLASIFLFFSIALVRWRFHDDFEFRLLLDEKGLFQFLKERYLYWDARFFMPFFIVWFFLYNFLSFKVLMLLSSLSFFLSSFVLVKILSLFSHLKHTTKETFILAVVLNFLLWFSFKIHLSQSLYWLTGSYIIHNVLLGLIWIYFYLRHQSQNRDKFPFMFYVFSIFVATSSQNITLGLIALIFIDLVIDLARKRSLRNKFLLFIFFAGIILATVSPGSFAQFKRMQTGHYTVSEDLLPLKEYVFHIFNRYLYALEPNWFLISGTALFFISLMFIFKGFSIKAFEIRFTGNYHKKNSQFIILFLEKFKWLIVAFSSIIIYWPTVLYNHRYFVGFYYYLFIFFFSLFSPHFRIEKEKVKSFSKKLTIGFFAFILLISSIDYFRTFQDSKLVQEFMNEREEFLEKNRGAKRIYLDAIEFSTFTKTLKQADISNNQNYLNKVYSTYFQIDSVFVSKYLTKEGLKERIKEKK